MALINCPKCGKKISDNSNKCIKCGATLKNNNEKRKNIIILIVSILVIIALIGIIMLILTKVNNKPKKASIEEILSSYTWVSDTDNKLKINFDNLNKDSSKFYTTGSCMVYSDDIDNEPTVEEENCFFSMDKENYNIKVSFTLYNRNLDNGSIDYDLVFDKKDNQLKMMKNDKEIIFKRNSKENLNLVKEPYYKNYYLTNKYKDKTAVMALYRNNYCEISFSDFARRISLGGGDYIYVIYKDGECTYEKVGDLDFVIKYTGTFTTTTNIPGLNNMNYNYVFQTDNQEMKITFNDDKYKDFTITNGEYDMVNYALYFKGK